MHKLPPLNGLRAFEAAARCGSFVEAGQELAVSSAAISLQVKNLEEHLGKKLFLRQGNRIFLTDAGEAIYPKIGLAFTELSEAAEIALNNQHNAQLVISVMPSLSEPWLLPKVMAFREKTGASVHLRVDADPVNFAREGIDLRITYGSSSLYAGYREIRLFSGVAVPVCSPDFWQSYADAQGTLKNIPDALLIHNRWGSHYSTEPNWTDWMKLAGHKSREFNDYGLIISDMSLSIAAARLGAGIALVPSVLAQQDIEAQRLVQPSSTSLKMKKDYVCVHPHARSEYSILREFLDLLSL